MRKIIFFLNLFLILCLCVGCGPKKARREVVIYTSQDQVYSEVILKDFEKRTGIKVLAVYDVEAAKTIGLVNRLIAEKAYPQADVFWNSEFAQTILLKEKGVLASYHSPNSAGIPSQYLDPDGFFSAFGARARVILVNTKKVDKELYPKSVLDLLNSALPAKEIGMPYPIFGTALTQAAALYAAWGQEKARDFYQKLHDRGVRVVDGNSVVRDLVASGELSVGMTDSDDSCGAIKNNAPVEVIFTDQDTCGTLIVPNTAALIRGSPHPQEAKELIDYLLSKDVEAKLMEMGAIQMSLHPGDSQTSCLPLSNVKGFKVRLSEICANIIRASEDLKQIFVR